MKELELIRNLLEQCKLFNGIVMAPVIKVPLEEIIVQADEYLANFAPLEPPHTQVKFDKANTDHIEAFNKMRELEIVTTCDFNKGTRSFYGRKGQAMVYFWFIDDPADFEGSSESVFDECLTDFTQNDGYEFQIDGVKYLQY